MPAIIVTILKWFTGFALAKFFTKLAIGIISYSIVQFFFDKYINQAFKQLTYMGDLVNYLAIAQADHAISIIIGALSIKGFMKAASIGVSRQGA